MLDEPTLEQIDAILPFLDLFEKPDFVAGSHLAILRRLREIREERT